MRSGPSRAALPGVLVVLMLAASVPAMGQLCGPWQLVAGDARRVLWGVAWGGGRWVAVGEGGRIVTSDDGLKWRRVAPVTTADLQSVAWGAPGFVAFSTSANGTVVSVLVSPDGDRWEERSVQPEVLLGPVAWGLGKYVMMSQDGVFTSLDGVGWVRARAPEPGLSPESVIFDGTRFVAIGTLAVGAGGLGDAMVLTSADTVTWDLRRVAYQTRLRDLAWNGTRYVAVGTWYSAGLSSARFLVSRDAISWQAAAAPQGGAPWAVVAGSGTFVALACCGSMWTSPDGLTWAHTEVPGPVVTDIATDGSLVVAVASDDAIFASEDGTSWTPHSAIDFPHMADVVWAGRRYVAVGAAGTVMLSPDGVAWETIAPITNLNLGKVLVVGTKLQAFSEDGAVFESPDGRSWRARPTLRAPSSKVAYGDGAYVGLKDGVLESSPNLVTWREHPLDDADLIDIEWTGSFFVGAGLSVDATVGKAFTSSNGESWKLVFNSGLFRYGYGALAVNANTIVILSSDVEYGGVSTDGGTSWRNTSMMSRVLGWAGSRFAAFGDFAATSWDGIEWVDSGPLGLPALVAIAGTQRHIVAVGDAIIRGECPAGGEPIYLPAAAHNSGENATKWRTDAFVANLGTTQASFTLELLQRNRENLTPASTTFTLAPGVMATYPDVVGSVFNLEGAGTLRVTPLDGEVTASERVYETTGPAAFGQHVAGLADHTAFGPGQRARLIGLSQSASASSGARTNIGVVNASAERMVATVELYRADGTLLGTRTYPLRPYQSIQQTRIFAEVTADAVPAGYAIVSTPTEGARFFAYAFLVDNVTGAPELVFPQ